MEAPMSLTASPRTTHDRMENTHHIGWRHILSRRMVVTDAMVLAITMAIAISLRFGIRTDAVTNGAFKVTYPTFAAIVALAWLVVLAAFDTRDPHIIAD